MKTAIFVALLCIASAVFAQEAQPTTPENNPRNWAYDMKTFARAAGNAGGWWSFMNDSEKAAFLDGYQQAMHAANQEEASTCEAARQVRLKDSTPLSIPEASTIVFFCTQQSATAGFDKVTVKDLDEFYSEPINQPMPPEWTLPYLRDKVTGRKTAGQLLSALQAQQKDVHDCSKYPALCKLGAPSEK